MQRLQITVEASTQGGFHGRVLRWDGFVHITDPCESSAAAHARAMLWAEWHEGRNLETIYYILAVPLCWPGPRQNSQRYSGLELKIGRTKTLLKRLENLRTGTSSQLIIHAIEPGDARLERIRHEEFAEERRQGEWFTCSERLVSHVLSVWRRNNLLPPEHQREVMLLQDRIDTYLGIRDRFGPIDLVNPSLSEPWSGRFLVDLVYATPGGVPRHTGRRMPKPQGK